MRLFHQHILQSCIALLLFSGCQPAEPIREYVVPIENDRIFTSDLLKDQFGAIPFEWETPDTWVIADNDQFSKIAWEVGPKGDEARITLSDQPLTVGLIPQLTRWRDQLGIKLGPKDDPMENTETLKLTSGNSTYVDFKGTETRFLGLFVPYRDKLWIFKLRGNNEIAEQQQEPFRKFCESVKVP